jgi:hypothetical protein
VSDSLHDLVYDSVHYLHTKSEGFHYPSEIHYNHVLENTFQKKAVNMYLWHQIVHQIVHRFVLKIASVGGPLHGCLRLGCLHVRFCHTISCTISCTRGFDIIFTTDVS